MNLFYRRPLALFSCLFAAASLCGCFFRQDLKLVFAIGSLSLALLFGLFALLFKKRRARLLTTLLCFVFIASALFNAYFRIDAKASKVEPILGSEAELELTVVSKISSTSMGSSYHVQFYIDETLVDGILQCDYQTNYEVGNRIVGKTVANRLEEHYENIAYYRAKNLFLVLVSSEEPLALSDVGTSGLRGKLEQINHFLATTLSDCLDKDSAHMISAILLGNRPELGDDVLRDFRRAGVFHVLAISGMHLSILVLLTERLLRWLKIHKRTRAVLIFFAALFYLALTGFSLSTTRAFIMISFVYLAYLSGNQNDVTTSLFFSLFLILAVSPAAVWDVGLWMSFLAVLGLLVGAFLVGKLAEAVHKTRIRTSLEKPLIRVLSAIIPPIFANCFVCLPLQLCFDELSLLSVLSTLIISPLISVLLLLAPFLLLAATVTLFSFLTTPLVFCCHLLCEIITTIIAYLSQFHGITVSLAFPFLPYIVIPAACLLFLFLILPLRRQFWIPLVPLLAFGIAMGMIIGYKARNENKLTVDYLSFGESEMLIMTTTEDTVICDLSTGSNQHLYDAIALSRQHFQTEVSAVVLTHYHTRHIYAISRNADRFMVRRLYLPYPVNADEYYIMYSIVHEASKRGVDVILFDRNREFSPASNITLTLSEPSYLKRSTHPTFLLSVSAFDQCITYIAESAHEATELAEELARLSARSDYVIMGTHGPITKNPIFYESLSAPTTLFVFDENLLNHIDPAMLHRIQTVYGSSKITIRLEN